MDALDPRHGTYPGYSAHQASGDMPPCEPCRRANAAYEARLQLDKLEGRQRKMSSLGARRRLRALGAIGWSRGRLSAELGINGSGWFDRLMASETCYVRTHERIAALYERLCMTLPPDDHSARLARAAAKRAGHAPPLAWNCIDTDEKPQGVRAA